MDILLFYKIYRNLIFFICLLIVYHILSMVILFCFLCGIFCHFSFFSVKPKIFPKLTFLYFAYAVAFYYIEHEHARRHEKKFDTSKNGIWLRVLEKLNKNLQVKCFTFISKTFIYLRHTAECLQLILVDLSMHIEYFRMPFCC